MIPLVSPVTKKATANNDSDDDGYDDDEDNNDDDDGDDGAPSSVHGAGRWSRPGRRQAASAPSHHLTRQQMLWADKGPAAPFPLHLRLPPHKEEEGAAAVAVQEEEEEEEEVGMERGNEAEERKSNTS
ncbi:unnamed protein product [Pleuronectes platessa]|uniref:Uncharacterized protein n=1 Tax=Pleuronectes platessa TaxID=8262 RepID=A0A9N7URH6_PLEPL|nr:unnamed protein product [Pleuronectes platessa]